MGIKGLGVSSLPERRGVAGAGHQGNDSRPLRSVTKADERLHFVARLLEFALRGSETRTRPNGCYQPKAALLVPTDNMWAATDSDDIDLGGSASFPDLLLAEDHIDGVRLMLDKRIEPFRPDRTLRRSTNVQRSRWRRRSTTHRTLPPGSPANVLTVSGLDEPALGQCFDLHRSPSSTCPTRDDTPAPDQLGAERIGPATSTGTPGIRSTRCTPPRHRRGPRAGA